jgi:FtsH-binding integral membrane protein
MTDAATEARRGRPIEPGLDARARFIARVYAHVAAAIVALVAFEVALFRSGLADSIRHSMRAVPWILILGAFMIVGWLARRVAWKLDSVAAQYGALGCYIVAKGLIILPLLYRADQYAPGAIESAAQLTLLMAAALTLVVWWTRRDFTFLRGILRWGGIMALVAIITAVSFGWYLGTWFNLAMVTLAGGSVLYDTTKVMKHHRRNRYVAEALSLFASIALMFYYVLRQLSRSRRLVGG